VVVSPLLRFGAETRGILNTADDSVGAFNSVALSDIESVGVTFDYTNTTTDDFSVLLNGQIRMDRGV